MRKTWKVKILSLLMCVVPMCYCALPYADDAPVVSANDEIQVNHVSTTGLSLEQRMRQMENKLEFLSRANLVEDMQIVRQTLQELQGTIELQKHELEKLARQQKNFYSDLDRRLAQPANTKALNKPAETNSTAAGEAHSTTRMSQSPDKLSPPKPAQDHMAQSAHDDRGQKAYGDAYHLISLRRYQDALTALGKFVTDYPKSPYVANAHYWLGELYVQKGERQLALQQFELIKASYPKNNKIADAKYKIGLINKMEGNIVAARAEFLDLMNRYRGTSAAELAALQLRTI